MWYALKTDEGIIAEAESKRELLKKIADMDTRCKRLRKGVYAYEQRDESERSTWHEIAYIYSSKELAIVDGWEHAFIAKWIDKIVEDCNKLNADESITVPDFGENKDLELNICKNCNFNREKGEFNRVIIHIKKNGNHEKDIEAWITENDLWDELDKLYYEVQKE